VVVVVFGGGGGDVVGGDVVGGDVVGGDVVCGEVVGEPPAVVGDVGDVVADDRGPVVLGVVFDSPASPGISDC
jgi:hypothetical protein